MIRHYINLTNGIQQLPHIPKGEPYSFVRIQSTTLERKDWIKLFSVDIDHDLLMHLALGYTCVLHDRGTNRPRSKTVYLGVPIIEYVLNKYWFGLDPDIVRGGGRHVPANYDITEVAHRAYDTIFKSKNDKSVLARTKLKYYSKFINCGCISLIGKSSTTDKDGDYEYHKTVVHRELCK